MEKMQVKKRDGKIEDFDTQPIRKAIEKAFIAVNEKRTNLIEDVLSKVLSNFQQEETYDIEFIQNCVEKALVESNLYEISKAYMLYRQQHQDLRDLSFVLASNELMDDYLKILDWKVKENSNMSFSLQGLNNHISTGLTSGYWLNRIYPEKIRNHHKSGDFHLHDLGTLGVYCCGWDLQGLLTKGFGGVEGKIQSNPPKRLRVALGQITNFFYTLQGEAAGAQAFSNFDTYLAPFVANENLSYEEVKQAMQEFVFNLNIPTRVGFQTPFTNITMDVSCPKSMKDSPAIIGGKPTDKKLEEFQKEMDMINRAFAEVMSKGDAKGRVFTFPIPTYNITKDFDWDNKVFDPIWEMTSKYGIPYFSNFINSDMDPDDARSMCCRLRLDNRELRSRGGGLFGSNPLTGSIGVVTINLPRLGFKSKNEAQLFHNLGQLMDQAKESLIIKRKVLENYTAYGLYPYSKYYLEDIFKANKNYWGNHFSTIGLLGMNELLINFLGINIASKEGKEYAEKIMDFMRDRILNYQKETGDLFNLEATPAEGTSHRLALLDKEKYPKIQVANEEMLKKDPKTSVYYTNSSQLPVNQTADVFEALDLQDNLQTKYTGGTVFHMFIGENHPSPEAVKKLVRKIAENYKLPYFTLTPTFSVCPNHGYIAGENHKCPECDAKCEVYSRVVGYIRPIENWNDGKRSEFGERVTFEMQKAK